MKAMVVDDDDRLRLALARIMAREGFEVSTAADGAQALAAMASSSPDVVVTDLKMPAVDGLELVRRIRSQPDTAYTYVIMLTGWGDRDARAEGMASGVDDFLTKPAQGDELVARLRVARRIMGLQGQLAGANRALVEQNRILAGYRARVERELESAATVQRSLLPRGLPAVPGIRVGWSVRPAEELAGDFLGVHDLGEDRLGLFVVDVSGHGVSAALLAAQVARVLTPELVRSRPAVTPLSGPWPLSLRTPREVVAELSRVFPPPASARQFFTMVYAIADSRRRVVQVTCAGHPGPLLLPKSKPPRYLELPGSPIALVEGGSWAVESFPLGPGDRLALVSDGLLEATDARGQMVGVGRLLRMFRRYQGVEPQRACDAVIAEVEEWCRPAGFQDDCSLVMLEAVEEESVAVL